MSANKRLMLEFQILALEELDDAGITTDINEHLLPLITSWCEVYEDVPPRNRAEVAVRDALEEVRGLLAHNVHRQLQPKN